SGSDYPIEGRDYLEGQLGSGREFSNFQPGYQSHKPEHRLSGYYLQKLDRKRRFSPRTLLYTSLEKLLRGLGYRRPTPEMPGSGANWFFLSGECILFILRYLDEHPGFVNYFKHALSPDEYFFQTLI